MAKEAEDKKTVKVKRPTPLKRDIQNTKRRVRNKVFKSKVKSAVRSFEEILKKEDAQTAKESLNQVYSLLDKAAKKGIYKGNKSSRTKARLHAHLAAKKS